MLVVTINEANMGLRLAAIAKRYMKELLLLKKKKDTDGNDGMAQVGINLKQMLANQKIAASENLEIFGTEKLHTFVSQRTPEGDLLIMWAHTAARDAMKEICLIQKSACRFLCTTCSPKRAARGMQPRNGTPNLAII